MKQNQKMKTRLKYSIPKLTILMCFILMTTQMLQASKLELGLRYGMRKVQDVVIKEIYGDGYVFNPYIRWMPHPFFAFEVAYEGGYAKEAPIGLFDENSTLSLTGWEICMVLHYRFNRFDPYVRFGYANYHYKQEIDSEFLRQKVDHRKATSLIAGGLKVELFKGLNIGGEVKYSPMKVQPFEVEVDLSGLRYMLSLSYEFNF